MASSARSSLSAVVFGGTGEVGKELISALVKNEAFKKVTVAVRKKTDKAEEVNNKLHELVVNYENLEDYKESLANFDVGFCCLGTTRAKAGAEGFVKVDRDYVVKAAELIHKGGCQDFHVVTAKGSNKNSWFLYPRTKGEAEESLKEMGFEKLAIYHPGLLLCKRQERRFLESVAISVVGTLDFGRALSVTTKDVAEAMIKKSLQAERQKVEIVDHGDIVKLAKAT